MTNSRWGFSMRVGTPWRPAALRGRGAIWTWWAACLVLILGVTAASAQGLADASARIRGHLQAGEFAPALALANAVEPPAERDPLLAEIAQAQARSGARDAAFRTLRAVRDDRVRTYALDRMSGSASGGRPEPGAAGGGTMADFDTLIELITSTIAPQTWDTVGGPGAIDSFPTGVYVDSGGMLCRIRPGAPAGDLAAVRQQAAASGDNRDVLRASGLRKVSLTRLEKQVQFLAAQGLPPAAAMQNLAGLHRVKYVFVYPESRDIVVAGPAGPWSTDDEGRCRNTDSGEPVLQLDDLVVVLRNAQQQGGRFGCSITPRRENLAATQAFLNESAKSPLKPGQRDAWLSKIRELMGRQDITVDGVDPQTRVARVIVEADYRMKLVGMGLEDGVLGVSSYLDSVPVPEDGGPPPMSVLRWWFTMNYQALRATPGRDAVELVGPGVQVLSENEMLTLRGERIHTGTSDELNEQFAHSFTKHFDQLAAKYPIYADLRNVFDLALVAGLIVAEDLPGQIDWPALHFTQDTRYRVPRIPAPVEVETVINHRVIGQKHIVAGVSGGVTADASRYLQKAAIATDNYGALQAGHTTSKPGSLPEDAWWWD